MNTNWKTLIQAYARTPIDTPVLKVVTLAQWALESGYGTSELARQHLNFGGLKFRARINQGREDRPLAVPVDYLAHDGEDTYSKFASIEDFIAGYWAFVENGPMYNGWQTYASDPSGYIGHLYRGGYAADPNYVSKVLALLPTIRSQVEELGLSADVVEPLPTNARVAVVIGHNQVSKGAYSSIMTVYEWDYNRRVAAAMKGLAAEFGIELEVFLRQRNASGFTAEINTAYAAVDAWNPDLILELHFNASNGAGSGTEMLYWHTSASGRALADAVGQAVVTELALRDRGSKPRRGGELGSTSLKASRHPTIITEPFFGDNRTDSQRMLALGEPALARAYLIGVRDFLVNR